jgi:hypothetical protein
MSVSGIVEGFEGMGAILSGADGSDGCAESEEFAEGWVIAREYDSRFGE